MSKSEKKAFSKSLFVREDGCFNVLYQRVFMSTSITEFLLITVNQEINVQMLLRLYEKR